MKLLLTSTGFTNEKIISSLENLTGKVRSKISSAIINEGFVPEIVDHRWVIDELSSVAKNIGGEIDIVNLLALSEEQIMKRVGAKDAIYVLGGHIDYLMYVFNKSGFSKMLPHLLEDNVYIGSSAGSMVIGKRVSTEAYQEIYGEEGTYGTDQYMELVDFAIKPHLTSPHFPKTKKGNLIEVSQTYDGLIHCLRDDQAIVVNGNETTFINGPVLSLQKGKEIKNE